MLDFHASVIRANIEQTTAGATRRRKQAVWPWAVLAAICLLAMLAVIAGLAQ